MAKTITTKQELYNSFTSRGIKSLPPVTLIVGENEVGKTEFMKRVQNAATSDNTYTPSHFVRTGNRVEGANDFINRMMKESSPFIAKYETFGQNSELFEHVAYDSAGNITYVKNDKPISTPYGNGFKKCISHVVPILGECKPLVLMEMPDDGLSRKPIEALFTLISQRVMKFDQRFIVETHNQYSIEESVKAAIQFNYALTHWVFQDGDDVVINPIRQQAQDEDVSPIPQKTEVAA